MVQEGKGGREVHASYLVFVSVSVRIPPAIGEATGLRATLKLKMLLQPSLGNPGKQCTVPLADVMTQGDATEVAEETGVSLLGEQTEQQLVPCVRAGLLKVSKAVREQRGDTHEHQPRHCCKKFVRYSTAPLRFARADPTPCNQNVVHGEPHRLKLPSELDRSGICLLQQLQVVTRKAAIFPQTMFLQSMSP